MKKLLIILICLISINCFGANKYVDGAGAGLKDGSSWANAYGGTEFEAYIEGGTRVNTNFWIASGTYTLTSNFVSAGNAYGSAFIGVKSGTTAMPPSSADFAYGTERALFSCGAYQFVPLGDDSASLFNIQVSSAYAGTVLFAKKKLIWNCKVSQLSASAGYKAIDVYYSTLVGNEVISTNGTAVYMNTNSSCSKSYIHDSSIGVYYLYSGLSISNSIITDCTDGVTHAAYKRTLSVVGCTFVDCVDAIILLESGGFFDCLIKDSTRGLVGRGTLDYYTGVASNVNFYNVTTKFPAGVLMASYSELDPEFIDEASGDLEPENKSLIDEIFPLTFAGDTVSNNSIAGAIQLDASSSGGGQTSYAYEN